MLTKEKVVHAMQTLPTSFTIEELLQQVLLLEDDMLPEGHKDEEEFIGEAETSASTENFKGWASLA